jgi:hypothetical protein
MLTWLTMTPLLIELLIIKTGTRGNFDGAKNLEVQRGVAVSGSLSTGPVADN